MSRRHFHPIFDLVNVSPAFNLNGKIESCPREDGVGCVTPTSGGRSNEEFGGTSRTAKGSNKARTNYKGTPAMTPRYVHTYVEFW